jgi:hypothetical protein
MRTCQMQNRCRPQRQDRGSHVPCQRKTHLHSYSDAMLILVGQIGLLIGKSSIRLRIRQPLHCVDA